MQQVIGGILFIGLALPAAAQEPLRGPRLGFVWDSRQESIRPVQGILGSSVLGPRTELGFPVKAAAIAPNQEYAVGLGGDERKPYLVDLRPVSPETRAIEMDAGAERVTLSPSGTAAAFWYPEARRLRIVAGLPASLAVAREFDLSLEGAPVELAVADDGSTVLASFPETPGITVLDEFGNRSKAPVEVAVRSFNFMENSRNALLALDDGVIMIRDIASAPEVRKIWDGTTARSAASLGSERILIIDSANITEMSLVSDGIRFAECPCEPLKLVRMGSSLVRLNDVSAGPLWLLEISEAGLRTVFVPPDPSEPEPTSVE